MVVLPEMWNCPYSNESFPTFAEDLEGDRSQSAAAMAEAAKQHGITLVAGSIPEKHAGRLYNTCLVYNSNGQRLARFRKVSLAGRSVVSRHVLQQLCIVQLGGIALRAAAPLEA